jgi:hypothetical protein
MIGHRLQYFCVECGKELLNRTLIDNCGYHSSQECIKCGYALLFGTIKIKLKECRRYSVDKHPIDVKIRY